MQSVVVESEKTGSSVKGSVTSGVDELAVEVDALVLETLDDLDHDA